MTLKLPAEFWINAAVDTEDNMFPSLTGGFLMEITFTKEIIIFTEH